MSEAKPAGGVIGLLVVCLALALAGAGGGYVLVRQAMATARSQALAEPASSAPDIAAAYTGPNRVVPLQPVVATMATPGVWVRLEGVLVHDASRGELAPDTVPAVAQDIVALLRTLTVAHVSGASGFLHLKEDIDARAALRSDGRVREVLIQTLVYE